METKFKTAVIVGLGSIGMRHFEFLSDKCERILLIDPKFNGINFYENKCETFSNISEIPEFKELETLAVISNWGPDHLETLKVLKDKGITKFVLEKPMVSSFEQLFQLDEISNSSDLTIVVNQGWHHIKLSQRVKDLGMELNLGNPVSVIAWGGARCHSTFGSHVIHFASGLLGSEPSEISANFINSQINPRGHNLAYLEGNFSLLNKDGSRLFMNFTNSSSVSGGLEILWREAHGSLIDDFISLKTLSKDREFREIITRYGVPEIKLFEGKVPSYSNNFTNQIEALYASLKNEKSKDLLGEFKSHITSNKILLLGCIASDLKRTVKFNESFSKEYISKDYKIS